MSITVVEHARFLISRFSKNKQLIPLRKSLQTMSASPCRTQVQPAASFLVCSLIFIKYKKAVLTAFFYSKTDFQKRFQTVL